MRLTEKQIRAIHAKKWNSPKTPDDVKRAAMRDVGFGQSADIKGTGKPLIDRKYKKLPRELRDQFVLTERDSGI